MLCKRLNAQPKADMGWGRHPEEKWAMPQAFPPAPFKWASAHRHNRELVTVRSRSNVAGGTKPSEILRENVGIQFLSLRQSYCD
jgi:hypothetical protein